MSVNFQVTGEIIQEMVNVIVEEVQPTSIILFGSYAREDARSGSDIDFLVVTREPFGSERSRRKEAAKLWKALARFRVSKDILLFSQDEVETWSRTPNHIVMQALREGKTFYESA
ncbi:MAG: nucleotidyltransferase domain-containing protein [Desulfotomaculum sp.]|nr:nucleotidyltransferase domain-containing protein [Desulfotomaculum sp.]